MEKNRIFVERVNEGDWGQYIVCKEFNFFCGCQDQWHCGMK